MNNLDEQLATTSFEFCTERKSIMLYSERIDLRRDGVTRLEGRVVSGSDLIPLQYVFKDLVNV